MLNLFESKPKFVPNIVINVESFIVVGDTESIVGELIEEYINELDPTAFIVPTTTFIDCNPFCSLFVIKLIVE